MILLIQVLAVVFVVLLGARAIQLVWWAGTIFHPRKGKDEK